MLGGVSVSEIGGTVAAAAAGAMFVRLGASVTKFVTDTGTDDRPRSMRAEAIASLDRGKAVRHLPHAWSGDGLPSIADADVVVADISSLSGTERDHYLDQVPRLSSNVWVTLSPFGSDGERRHCRGTEITGLASGGISFYMRNSEGRPMKPAGHTASIAAGHFCVLAALHGLMSRQDGAGPMHMDVSFQDCVLVTGVFLECAHDLFDCPGAGGTARYMAPRGLVPAADGPLNIVVLEDHQWLGVVRAMGDPEWARDIRTGADRGANADLIQREIEQWAGEYTAAECARLLQAEGVPATPVNSCRYLLDDPDLAERGFFIHGSGAERAPGVPAVEHAVMGEGGASGTHRTGRTRRVLDLTHVLAGPLATSWLGTMGVDVVKVEDPDRTDVYRRRGPFPGGVSDIESSAYFSISNYSKRSMAVELESPAGRDTLRDLMAGSDLVLENLSANRARRIGLVPENFQDPDGPRLISSSGFGRTTSIAHYRAYGHNIHAFGGVIDLSRDRNGQPTDLGTSWADPLTAIWIAVLSAAELLRPRRERTNVEVSMVEVVAYQFPEYFAVVSRDGTDPVADESRSDEAAPHGFYRCAGEDSWIAIDVRGDDEWQRLVTALGDPESLDRPEFADAPGRLAAVVALDQAMDAVLRPHAAGDLFRILQNAGVTAAPVWGAADLIADRHLRDRGLFQLVRHPVWGERALAGLPWREATAGPFPITPTPLLGQHTTDQPSAIWRTERDIAHDVRNL